MGLLKKETWLCTEAITRYSAVQQCTLHYVMVVKGCFFDYEFLRRSQVVCVCALTASAVKDPKLLAMVKWNANYSLARDIARIVRVLYNKNSKNETKNEKKLLVKGRPVPRPFIGN
jgi:hypothetical protein